MTVGGRAVLDTSVFIAWELARPLDAGAVPAEVAISAVTLGELHAGVLAAPDTVTRARRLATVEAVADLEVVPVDEEVAAAWAALRVQLADRGCRITVNDLWIAATALAHGVPVVSQDADFDPLAGVSGMSIIRV